MISINAIIARTIRKASSDFLKGLQKTQRKSRILSQKIETYQ